MRGTGPVEVNGTVVYAYFTEGESGSVRLRVSVDEWDRLGIAEGLRVRVGLPGREAVDVLVTDAHRIPPFVWLDLFVLSHRPASRAG